MATTTSSEECYLLEKIPAEIRNNIYELSFSTDGVNKAALTDDGNSEVNLFEAKPPNKSLLLSCKQIHSEAKGIWRSAYQEYWRKTHFKVRGDQRTPRLRNATDAGLPKDADLNNIMNITIRDIGIEMHLEDPAKSIWAQEPRRSHDSNAYFHFIYAVCGRVLTSWLMLNSRKTYRYEDAVIALQEYEVEYPSLYTVSRASQIKRLIVVGDEDCME